ncbi:MAG: hypothetical protein AAFX03_01965 [Pseudomonadota bacterium]
MADIVGIAASAASGGLFGLFGTALGRVASFFERRQEQAHERARWAHEAKQVELEMQADREKTQGEIALADTAGRWSGLTASMEAEAAIGDSYAWVNAVRGLTRPALTLLLWLIAAGIYVRADEAGQAAITKTAAFAATAATLWWFGDRGPSRSISR